MPEPDGPMMASRRPGLAVPETPSRMRLGFASAPSFFLSFFVGWSVMRTSSQRTTTSSLEWDPSLLLPPGDDDSSSRSLSLARMPRRAASASMPGILICGGLAHSAMPVASSIVLGCVDGRAERNGEVSLSSGIQSAFSEPRKISIFDATDLGEEPTSTRAAGSIGRRVRAICRSCSSASTMRWWRRTAVLQRNPRANRNAPPSSPRRKSKRP